MQHAAAFQRSMQLPFNGAGSCLSMEHAAAFKWSTHSSSHASIFFQQKHSWETGISASHCGTVDQGPGCTLFLCLHAGWLPVMCRELKWLLDNRTTARLQLSRQVWDRVYNLCRHWAPEASDINVACPLAAEEFLPWLLEILDISLGYACCLWQEAFSSGSNSNISSSSNSSRTSTCRSSRESSSTTSSSGSSNCNAIARAVLVSIADMQAVVAFTLLNLGNLLKAGSPVPKAFRGRVLNSHAVAFAAEGCFLGTLQKVELKHSSSNSSSGNSTAMIMRPS